MSKILMQPNLPKSVRYRDRLRRYGLYYSTKVIERKAPPKIVINSFWRSGSTLLLEFLADIFQMRPYFEPLVPGEPKSQFLFDDAPNQNCNPDRFHPVLSNDADKMAFKRLIEESSFQSKWVYQCQSRNNFTASNGKILKMVRGAHLLPRIQNVGAEVIHLSRDVNRVAKSFINSKWTNQFFKNVDLTYLAHVKNPKVSGFYKNYLEFLDLRKFNLVEQVAIYHTLSEKYVRLHNPDITYVDYEEFLNNPEDLLQILSKKLNIDYDLVQVVPLLSRPSRMTVANLDKRSLTKEEKNTIKQIVERISATHY